MTAQPEHPAAPGPAGATGDDPTRDIRLPPIPGRAAPALPAGWARPSPAEEGPLAEEGPPAEDASVAERPVSTAVDQPTDTVGRPPTGARERTLTFDGTAAQRWAAGLAATPDPAWSPLPQRAGPVVGPRPRPAPERGRRWPWIVLTLIPVLIIVGTGIWLLLLLRAA